MSIAYWDREKQRVETENVNGGALVNLLYGNGAGLLLADLLLARKPLSRAYGALQSSARSGRKVAPFISRFGVNMDEFEPGPFRSFNDFFIRRFREGRRPFPTAPREMGAFAEARYFAFEAVDRSTALPVKGLALSALDVLGGLPGKTRFAGGPCLLARLCPVDYHRFHFPDSGSLKASHTETGKLHSVNPAALLRKPDLFLGNEREISLLETDHFGALAYVEVGALCVGRIVQSFRGENFARGQEKGYFLFGGSTVIVYGEPGAWVPAPDLLAQTRLCRETLVRLGSPVAFASRKS